MSAESSLQKTSLGLMLLYGALCVLLVSLSLPIVLGVLRERDQINFNPTWIFLLLWTILPLLNIAGRVLCLIFAPTGGLGKTLVGVSLGLDAITLLLVVLEAASGLPAGLRSFAVNLGLPVAGFVPQVVSANPLLGLVNFLTLLSTCVFLFFLRELASEVGNRRLSLLALITFGLGAGSLLLVLILGAAKILLPAVVSMILGLLAVATFVLYGNLLTYLRLSVRKFRSHGHEEKEEEAPRSTKRRTKSPDVELIEDEDDDDRPRKRPRQ